MAVTVTARADPSAGFAPGRQTRGVDDDESNGTGQLVSTETKIAAVFVALGVVLWYGSAAVTESQPVRFAILLGVGVIAPTVINELRG